MPCMMKLRAGVPIMPGLRRLPLRRRSAMARRVELTLPTALPTGQNTNGAPEAALELVPTALRWMFGATGPVILWTLGLLQSRRALLLLRLCFRRVHRPPARWWVRVRVFCGPLQLLLRARCTLLLLRLRLRRVHRPLARWWVRVFRGLLARILGLLGLRHLLRLLRRPRLLVVSVPPRSPIRLPLVGLFPLARRPRLR